MNEKLNNKPNSKKNKKKSTGFLDRHWFNKSENSQLRYLPQSVKLEEAVNPHIIRLTMIMISAAILIFILWASVTNIKEITKAHGEVVPKGFVQVVQHLDGGIITEILTNEGDLVKESQILLRINDGGTKQDFAEKQAKQRFLKIEAERLSAFINDREPNFEKFLENNKLTNIDKNSTKPSEEIEEMYKRSTKLKENLKIAKEALSLQKNLFEQGYTSKLTILKYQKEVNKIEAEAHHQLNKIEGQIAQNREVISKLENRLKRLEVRSPVYGLVKGLKINTIGSIIEPGKTLMEIVPLDKNLVIEARLSPKDIGHIQIGQTVRAKVSSYDFSRYGAVLGKLEFISATTFTDQNNKHYYSGRIKLSKNYVGNNPAKNIILPGMTVEADIITGEKTILDYLLKPIHLSLKTAFTER